MSIYDENEKRIILEAYNGNEVEIVRVVNSALYKLANAKGGVLDGELEGMFTTPQKAKEAFDSYNSQGKQKIAQKIADAKAKEDAVAALLVAEPTPDNYVEQRKAKIKQEKAQANG